MTPAEARTLRAGAEHLGVSLDASATARIDAYLALLAVWNRRVRLTGERGQEDVIRKHVVDSLAIVQHLPTLGLVVDIGSGAGFPGIIAACVRPDLPLALVESRRLRASFLGEVVRSIGLSNARVLEMRAEDASDAGGLRAQGALVTGRAIRLDELIRVGAPLVAPDGVLLAMQTPRLRQTAAAVAERHGLRLSAEHPYTLLDGERRLLLRLERPPTVP
jgi:16S rRNA (guanine527-N7)-methyltransferase